jgi:HEAT repeat protein
MLAVCQGAIRAQSVPAPDIRTLMEQLSDPKTTQPDTFKKIVELTRNDPNARAYVVQKLPDMIRGPESDVWLDAIRLAGKLKIKEAIPALQQAMSRPPVPAEPFLTFAGIYRLDADLVAKTLSQFGDPAIPTVVNLLRSGDAGTRGRAVLILRNIGSPAARKVLQDRLTHETDPDVKKLIVDCLHS